MLFERKQMFSKCLQLSVWINKFPIFACIYTWRYVADGNIRDYIVAAAICNILSNYLLSIGKIELNIAGCTKCLPVQMMISYNYSGAE